MATAPAQWWQRAQRYLLTAAAPPATAFPSADVLELYHLRYDQVEPDGLSRQLVQRIFAIRTNFGARTFGVGDFWYDASRWSFHLLRGVVLAPDGQRWPVTDDGDVTPGASGEQARALHLPKLQVGDRVDIIYTLTPIAAAAWKPMGDGYLGDLFAFRANYPVERVRYVVCSPKPIAAAAVRVASVATSRRPGEYVWDWSSGPLPAFWREPDGPSITDASPYVQTGAFASWNGLARWYSQKLAAQAPLNPAFRARLLRLVPPQPSRLATVQAVWRYLAHHLDYWGEETGLHAFLPSPPRTVLNTGRGDCKDGALLMTTWLRAEGVPADLALLRTWGMGTVANGAATMAAFDHAIVYVPGLRLWLDTTAPELHVGELPATDQGALALIVRPSQSRLVRIPIAPATANRTVQTFRLSPAGGGRWQIAGRVTAVGMAANRLRTQYSNPAACRARLAAWLRHRFADVQIQSVRLSGAGWADARAELDFRATIPRTELASPAGLAAAVLPRHFARRLASEVGRRQAQRIPTRWSLVTRWSAPATSCVPAPTATLHAAFGHLTWQRICAQQRMTTTVAVAQTATEIPAGRYHSYRAFWRRVDARMNRPLPAPAAARVAAIATAPEPATDASEAHAARPGAAISAPRNIPTSTAFSGAIR
ncbi:MAG: DUF3857 domain-containing protein [Terriglobales bacterium]